MQRYLLVLSMAVPISSASAAGSDENTTNCIKAARMSTGVHMGKKPMQDCTPSWIQHISQRRHLSDELELPRKSRGVDDGTNNDDLQTTDLFSEKGSQRYKLVTFT